MAKARLLIAAGADLTVVVSEAAEDLIALEANQGFRIERRSFRELDVYGMSIVIGATGIDAVDRQIARAAEE